jgi:hypothetical protein
LLIALALGYLVLYLAKREEKFLKGLGLFIGVFIIVTASLQLLGKLLIRVRICQEISRGGIKWEAPFPQKMAP